MSSGSRLAVGKLAQLTDDWTGSFGAFCGVLRPQTALIDPQYFGFVVRGTQFRQRIEFLAQGTSIKNLSKEHLLGFSFVLPPLHEQRRIARILSTIQKAAKSSDEEVRASRALRRSVLTTLLRDAEGSASTLPLEDVAKIERGRFTHRPRNDPAFYDGETPFIQTGDVTRGASTGGRIRDYSQTLNQRGLEVSRVFSAGTIAITIAANIGFAAMLTFPAAFPDSVIAITPTDAVDAEYLNYYLSTQREEMDRRAPRGTQKNINIEFLRPWPVLVPSPTVQRAVSQAMRAVETKIVACSQHAAALRQLFSSALSALLELAA
jgi:type I restriction enzyme S subunit